MNLKKRKFLVVAGAGLMMLVGGCQQGYIRAAGIEGTLRPVLDRHDDYVRADLPSGDRLRDDYLRSSQLLRTTLDAALRAED